MKILDAYAHVSLPRFMSADEYLKVMDDNGVEKAHICTAESCPDLAELSRAAVAHPDRFRVSGLPLGETPQEVLDSIRAQLDSGFTGLRISDRKIASQPEILDILGKAGATPFVVGEGGFPGAARHLRWFLHNYPKAIICAPHFAGVADPTIFDSDPDAAPLFAHPRFLVIFSRHGAINHISLAVWVKEVLRRIGWGRIMFGSEYPVALYRDEFYMSTTRWPDSSGLPYTDADQAAFLYGNAANHLFASPPRPARQLDEKWCRRDLTHSLPVVLFNQSQTKFPEEVNRAFLTAYLARGGEKGGPYRDFVAQVLAKTVKNMMKQ